jgi:hypothetical protein
MAEENTSGRTTPDDPVPAIPTPEVPTIDRWANVSATGHRVLLPRNLQHWMDVARDDQDVLLIGERGTGKEEMANLIHENSKRSRHAFRSVDCATLSDTLWQSELFGHKKGAFTMATYNRAGKTKEANQGTLFLDEITRSKAAMGGILRLVQFHEIAPLGVDATEKVDIRIIAATNAPKTMPPDLLDRFPHQLTFPPLRERREDIPVLLEYLLTKNVVPTHISVPWLLDLLAQQWAGNLRDLATYCGHVVRNATQQSEGSNARKTVDETTHSFVPNSDSRFGNRLTIDTEPDLTPYWTHIVRALLIVAETNRNSYLNSKNSGTTLRLLASFKGVKHPEMQLWEGKKPSDYHPTVIPIFLLQENSGCPQCYDLSPLDVLDAPLPKTGTLIDCLLAVVSITEAVRNKRWIKFGINDLVDEMLNGKYHGKPSAVYMQELAEMPFLAPDYEELPLSSDVESLLQKLLSRLDERTRIVVQMRYDGRSYPDIDKETKNTPLHIPSSTAYDLCLKADAKWRHQYELVWRHIDKATNER